MHVVDADQRLCGAVSVIDLLHADPARRRCRPLMDADPVRVTADADVVDVALLMADYNLTRSRWSTDDQLLGRDHRRRRPGGHHPRRLAPARTRPPTARDAADNSATGPT